MVDTPSLQASDDASAEVQKTPNRVTLQSLKDKIERVDYMYSDLIPHMTICVAITSNGFALVGKSTPADPENFDAALGKQFAFEDALRQMWPLEAYLLRERMVYMSKDIEPVLPEYTPEQIKAINDTLDYD